MGRTFRHDCRQTFRKARKTGNFRPRKKRGGYVAKCRAAMAFEILDPKLETNASTASLT